MDEAEKSLEARPVKDFVFCRQCGRKLKEVERRVQMNRYYCPHTGKDLSKMAMYLVCPTQLGLIGFIGRTFGKKTYRFHDTLQKGSERGELGMSVQSSTVGYMSLN